MLYFINIQEHLQVLEYIMVHLHINFYLPQFCQQQHCLTGKIRQWAKAEESLKKHPRPYFSDQGAFSMFLV